MKKNHAKQKHIISCPYGQLIYIIIVPGSKVLKMKSTRKKADLSSHKESAFFYDSIHFYTFLSWRGFRILVCYWINKKTVHKNLYFNKFLAQFFYFIPFINT
ncbi:hypothetical protein CN971_32155 [Bacillus thuringiensis]|uniref:Uncharacterized protein n=1 Tax=Bacillus thuringiensis TaxID=1428 RepID=A0A9X7BLX6_BACTU|nr:hypothetical protein COK99_20105 [Bacillus thuringiensis]PGN17270.1 hypothetical protein CN971_32155 [Bacillus thuringiensis]PGN26693.1 hypothetical protein CN969_06825 [Bacillus thuringiensis]